MAEPRESKSERKRQAARAKNLGAKLTALSRHQLTSIALPVEIADAILEYQTISKREAKRRQLQYIGRLIRGADLAELQVGLDEIVGETAQSRSAHNRLEKWRERLINEPDALTQYVAVHPGTDVKAMRDILRQHHAAQSRDEGAVKLAARKLFRLLKANEG
ncbi:MAG: DUF615 domain-containing protein [Gammaproteobacteria bacterium]|nr:DUF615 domain-containing protein [Gammaproteobacteria bacterium]